MSVSFPVYQMLDTYLHTSTLRFCKHITFRACDSYLSVEDELNEFQETMFKQNTYMYVYVCFC